MARKAIVLTFDQLHLGYLGCYGNDWVETPGFDRLGLRSIVFDQHFGESFAAHTQRCAWWTGAYRFPRPALPRARLPTLPAVLKQHGTSTRLVCETPPDDVLLALVAGAEHSAVNVETGSGVDESETPFAALVDESVRWLQTSGSGREASWLLWLNSQGVPTPWIPPRSCAARYLDRYRAVGEAAGAAGGLPADADRTPGQTRAEKRPVPPSDAGRGESGKRQTADDSGVDELSRLLDAGASFPVGALERAKLSETERQRLRILYAAYVTSIDRSLSRLLAAIDQSIPGEELLLIVAAAAGEPLGERAAFMESCNPPFWRLCEENVHVPLLVQVGGPENRLSGGVEMGSRRQDLVQTVDLAPTLMEWFGVSHCGLPLEGRSVLPVIRGETGRHRDYLCLGDGEKAEAIRTPGYYLVRPAESRAALAPSDEAEPPLLFIKPDDVWDVNDVASQSPDVAAALSATLDGFLKAARKSLPAEFPVLRTGEKKE